MRLLDFTFYLYLRKSKTLDNGNCPVYLRIVHHGIRKDLGTYVNVDPNKWDDQFKRVRGQGDSVRDTNTQLREWEENIKSHIRDLHLEQEYFTLEELVARIKGAKKITGLLEFYKLRYDELEEETQFGFSPNTLKVYKSTRNHLETYLNDKLRRKDFPIKQIDYNFINDFYRFLTLRNAIGQNSANKYLKTVKALLNEARKRKIITHNAFENYQIKAGRYDRTYLTEEELERIIQYVPGNPKVSLAKDYFLFVCFTGFHYSDVRSLRSEHFRSENGRKWIVKPRSKNGQSSVVPLLPMAEKVLMKHSSYKKKEEEVLKVYSNQKTNQHLKSLATACGIQKRLTCKVGRHTFATTVTLANGVPLESIGHMLGHTDIKTTQIYARVVHSKLSVDLESVVVKYG